MKINFVKYQACGNDYIYIDCLSGKTFDFSILTKKLSDRHFGIGGDGVVFILKSEVADCKMRMFNVDGSEGRMCGNAVRCVAKYMHDSGYISGNTIKIETLSGIKSIEKSQNLFTVDMGKVSFLEAKIKNKNSDDKKIVVSVDGKAFSLYSVSVGNPHAVIFQCVNDFCKIGSSIEKNPVFENGTNVEFVTPFKDFLEVKVWERGSGRTLSCGTGACAVAFSAIHEGFGQKNKWQKIKMEGGVLEVLITSDNSAFLKGEAVEVFRGTINNFEYENRI